MERRESWATFDGLYTFASDPRKSRRAEFRLIDGVMMSEERKD